MQVLQYKDYDKRAKSFNTTHGEAKRVKIALVGGHDAFQFHIGSPGEYRLKLRYKYAIFAAGKNRQELKTVHICEKIVSTKEYLSIERGNEINEDDDNIDEGELIPLKYEILKLEYIGRKNKAHIKN